MEIYGRLVDCSILPDLLSVKIEVDFAPCTAFAGQRNSRRRWCNWVRAERKQCFDRLTNSRRCQSFHISAGTLASIDAPHMARFYAQRLTATGDELDSK
jgi:hypothetical protein